MNSGPQIAQLRSTQDTKLRAQDSSLESQTEFPRSEEVRLLSPHKAEVHSGFESSYFNIDSLRSRIGNMISRPDFCILSVLRSLSEQWGGYESFSL